MAEMKLTNEETAALNRIDNELKKTSVSAVAAGGVEDLCKTYNNLKGSLELLVKILKKIPGFGSKAAAALEFLMKLANTVCAV